MLLYSQVAAVEQHLQRLGLVKCKGRRSSDCTNFVPQEHAARCWESPIAFVFYPVGWNFVVELKVCLQRYELPDNESILCIDQQMMARLETRALDNEFALCSQKNATDKDVFLILAGKVMLME